MQVAVVPVPHFTGSAPPQVMVQPPSSQERVAPTGRIAGNAQVVHEAPQASAVVFGTQVGAVGVPRLQKPGVSQTQLHIRAPPPDALQVASPSLAGVGAGQAVHDVPQFAGAVSSTHVKVGPVAGQR